MPEISDAGHTVNEEKDDDDFAILMLCRQGNTDAFAVLVRRHQKKMLNVAYRMIGNYEEACDVVQDAFLSAFRALGQFRGDAAFSTWLCGIVLNHARNHLKQRAVQARRHAVSFDDPFTSSGERAQRDFISHLPSVLDGMEKQELQETVQACIGCLDGEQREVLVLRDIQGYSYEEIGSALRLPQGTVRSRLFRARQELKGRLVKVLGDLI